MIYQIYPRSFQDSNGDGIGDLRGIAERLAYVAGLGVDAIWISPFYKSPMSDFGYDVADYRAVDPMFGDLAAFDDVVATAHDLGLKVVIDQVLNHTSDQHAWFRESREDRDNPKADWYVWADAKPDGTPPNNWLSIFGGAAWQWEPRRGQYYLHNFLASQPDLNFRCPAMVNALMGEVAFWLARGVDGLRLDTANFFTHDAALRDNPPRPPDAPPVGGAGEGNPYSMQSHVYDKSRPDNREVLARLRAVAEQYGGRFLLGEISDDDSLATAATYSRGGDLLHTGYTFDLLLDTYSAGHIRDRVAALEAQIEDGWPCWAFSNHDVMRVATRWALGRTADPRQAKMLLALLLCLRGTICLYQGEELGWGEADVPYARMQDPFGLSLYPRFLGRDGCRTPMAWQAAAAHGGFSTAEPWLPVAAEHLGTAVDAQETDPDSVLNACRSLLKWRREHAAMVSGDIAFLATDEPILALRRQAENETVVAAFNLGDDGRRVGLNVLADGQQIDWEAGRHSGAQLAAEEVSLAPFGFCVVPIKNEESR